LFKTGSFSAAGKKNGDFALNGNNVTVQASGKMACKASSDLTLKGSKISQN
jgi:type VI secretion system secreted protein VgrG